MKNIKDILTTVISVITAISLVVKTVMDALPADGSVDWLKILLAVAIALIGYFTGKNADGTSKTPAQLEAQKALETK